MRRLRVIGVLLAVGMLTGCASLGAFLMGVQDFATGYVTAAQRTKGAPLASDEDEELRKRIAALEVAEKDTKACRDDGGDLAAALEREAAAKSALAEAYRALAALSDGGIDQ